MSFIFLGGLRLNKRKLKRGSTQPGAGLFPRRLSQIAFQSCITTVPKELVEKTERKSK
jgi:hypothetical protein